jgi:hypothetical protein
MADVIYRFNKCCKEIVPAGRRNRAALELSMELI